MKIVSHLEDSRPNIKSADNENYLRRLILQKIMKIVKRDIS